MRLTDAPVSADAERLGGSVAHKTAGPVADAFQIQTTDSERRIFVLGSAVIRAKKSQDVAVPAGSVCVFVPGPVEGIERHPDTLLCLLQVSTTAGAAANSRFHRIDGSVRRVGADVEIVLLVVVCMPIAV